MTHQRQQIPPISSARLSSRRDHFMNEISIAQRDIVAAHAGPPRKTLRMAAAGVAVAALALGTFVVTSVTGGPKGTGPTAFAFDHVAGGNVDVKVVNSSVSASQMTAQLHAQGLAVSVEAVPVNPELVGHWVAIVSSAEVPSDVVSSLSNQFNDDTATLQLPASFPGKLTLEVGRPARAGEDWQVIGAPNAIAPAGLLYCQRLNGLSTSDAEKKLSAAGFTVHWVGPDHLTPAEPVTGALVAAAYVFDFNPHNTSEAIANPRDVNVVALPRTDSRFAANAWAGFTPAQAAAGTVTYEGC